MAWTYYYTDHKDGSDSEPDVVSDMLTKLNDLSNAQAATAKVGISDQASGPAYGVVFYNPSISTLPPYNLTGAWEQYTHTHSHNDQYPQSFEAICNMLNGEGDTALTDVQAAYARFSMTDYKSGYCHMTIFYQKIS